MKKYFLALIVYLLSSNALSTPIPEHHHTFYLDRTADQENKWNSPPTVYVCSGVQISKQRVVSAINFWRKLGYTIHGPVMNSKIQSCLDYNKDAGKIMIGSNTARVPPDNAAITRTWFNKYTFEIRSAFIEIKPRWNNKERVLEHEIGHALGWDHCNKSQHLMHAIYDLGGWDTSGLKNQQKMFSSKWYASSLEEKIYFD